MPGEYMASTWQYLASTASTEDEWRVRYVGITRCCSRRRAHSSNPNPNPNPNPNGHHQVLLAPPGALLCGESLTLPGRRLSLLMLGGGGLAFVAQVGLRLSGQWSVVSGKGK